MTEPRCSARSLLATDTANELAAGRGCLRAPANLGNPYLAHRVSAGQQFDGMSIALAKGIAARLGLALELVPFDSAPATLAALLEERIDIACLATDPSRQAIVAQTEPFISVVAQWLARTESGIARYEDIDRDGCSVVVARGTAYDLFVSRVFSRATVVRVDSQHDVFDVLTEGGYDVAAGMPMNFAKAPEGTGEYRRFSGGLHAIDQSLTCRKSCPSAARFLEDYVSEMKANGGLGRLRDAYRLADTFIPQ
ncbi:MAG: transporter substrate-binding domain-containing protein [Lautropia sp.]